MIKNQNNIFEKTIAVTAKVTIRKKISLLFNSMIIGFLYLITTPTYAHIKCPIKFLGTTNDKCPHIHSRPRETEESGFGHVPDPPGYREQQRRERQRKEAELREKQRQANKAAAYQRERSAEKKRYYQDLINQAKSDLVGKWMISQRNQWKFMEGG